MLQGPNEANESFSLQLRREADGSDIRVVSADVSRRGFRHRLTFGDLNSLDEVLEPDFCHFLRETLADVPIGEPSVVTKPDLALPLPGLILGRMRIISGDRDSVEHYVMVRFRYFIGGIQSAFAADCYFDRPALEHRDEIGVRALEDVAMPLLNLASLSKSVSALDTMESGVEDALKNIERQASELQFYASLLRRYVQECSLERTRSVERFDDPVSRVLSMEEPPHLFKAALPTTKNSKPG